MSTVETDVSVQSVYIAQMKTSQRITTGLRSMEAPVSGVGFVNT